MTSQRPRLPSFPSNLLRTFAFLVAALAAGASPAQDYRAGEIAIHQPFAAPTRPGASNGAAYFGGLENRGTRPDRLLRASSAAAARVELHSGEIGADGVMRMRELDAIALPAGTTVELRPGQGYHLMLIDLKKPLARGETFAMTLEFEHAGKTDVEVVVQESKPGAAPAGGQRH